MSSNAAALRELHRIHRQLGDVRDRLDRGPKQIKARQANMARLDQELSQVKSDAKAARVAADQKQLSLKAGESKIQELRVKLNAASSNREYQALKDQIAADTMANSVLADEILEALEKLDEFAAAIATAEQNVVKAKEELQRVELQVRDQQGILSDEVKRLEADLREAEKILPVDIRDAYDRMVKVKGADSMAQVEGETCGGCFQSITANMFNTLLLSRVVFCQSCGRLLYLPEDRSPGKK